VSGERAVRELLRAAPQRVERIWVDRGRELGELIALATQLGVKIETCDAARLQVLAGDVTCRGVLAAARPPPLHDLETLLARLSETPQARRPVLVALDGVQDPQNLGAIVRSCDFFGAAGVFWPRDRSVGLGPAMARASAGASERVALGEVTNLARALAMCRDADVWVLGTVPEGGESLPDLVWRDRLPEPLVVVMGGEHEGIRRLTRERCDLLATIPAAGGVASLNVSAATAVVLSWVTPRLPASG
jgi:23S rRNA (guanosine2251-2'-O)-methyltransferase